MKNKFLNDLLAVMIKQHGAEKVLTQLTQLHSRMSIPDEDAPKNRICNKCSGDLFPGHYCM